MSKSGDAASSDEEACLGKVGDCVPDTPSPAIVPSVCPPSTCPFSGMARIEALDPSAFSLKAGIFSTGVFPLACAEATRGQEHKMTIDNTKNAQIAHADASFLEILVLSTIIVVTHTLVSIPQVNGD